MTFSIVARTSDAAMFGVAIASSSPAVAARCAQARAGVGAVVTQNVTDPALAPQLLNAMQSGHSALMAMQSTLHATPYAAYRQLMAIGAAGSPAIHSGAQALGLAASASGAHAAAAGNLLANAEVPRAMLNAFEAAAGHLGARLLQAMRAAVSQGGEAGPIHSAGLLIVREVSWPIVDLRVDWSETDPIEALGMLWERYAPQIDDYVQRALNPQRAPSFGVPGNP